MKPVYDNPTSQADAIKRYMLKEMHCNLSQKKKREKEIKRKCI